MKRHLTDQVVRSLKAPARGQIDFWDSRRPGFGVRVSHGGTKTWVLSYRQSGIKRRFTLGRYPLMSVSDAHQAAKRYMGEVARGEDPAQARTEARSDPTFGEFAIEYLERHARPNKTARSYIEDVRMLNADLLPVWRNRKLSEIARRDVQALLENIVERGAPVHANRVLALVSKVFNVAIDRDVIEQNPAYKLKRPAPEQERSRFLTDDEIRRVWRALDSEPIKVAAFFKMLLLTAQRRGEVLGMMWGEIELDAGWWTLPAKRSKNSLPNRIPLVPAAVALLRSLKNESEFVFNSARVGRPIENPSKWIIRVRERAAIADFRFHDLRRTCASRLAELGIDRIVFGKLLNHSEAGVTKIYDRYSREPEKRKALERWANWLEEIVSNKPRRSAIVEMRPAG